MIVVELAKPGLAIIFTNVFFNPANHVLFGTLIIKRFGYLGFCARFKINELWKTLNFVSPSKLILLCSINHYELYFILATNVVFLIHMIDYVVPVTDKLFAEVAPFHVEFHDNVRVC